jgi:hypothetical protein
MRPEINTLQNESSDAIIDLIEKLSRLHGAGALTDDKFNSKKMSC